MDWSDATVVEHQRAQAALARTVNRASISVPIGDSPATAPGYLYVGHFYSCVPDPAYPWDPAVLRALRLMCPDAMPLVIRSVWRWSNYMEHGYIHEPIVLVRHGLARAIIDAPVRHDFIVTMPGGAPPDGLLIPGRTLDQCRPNAIEVDWQDREVREHGHDLPGAYLPFDWEFFHACRDSYDTNLEALRQSERREDDDGTVYAQGAARTAIESRARDHKHRRAATAEEFAYVTSQITDYHRGEVSDVELRDKQLGTGPAKTGHTVTEGVSA